VSAGDVRLPQCNIPRERNGQENRSCYCKPTPGRHGLPVSPAHHGANAIRQVNGSAIVRRLFSNSGPQRPKLSLRFSTGIANREMFLHLDAQGGVQFVIQVCAGDAAHETGETSPYL
jgi:hypothetical protein